MTRKVACLHAGACDQTVLRWLRDAGWEPVAVKIAGGTYREAPWHGCEVGLVWLPAPDPDLIARLRALTLPRHELELVAIASQEVLRDERAREYIATFCADYQTLPLDRERLLFSIGHAAGMTALAQHSREIRLQRPENPHTLIGRSTAIQALQHDLERVAAVDAAVMITGESGTGKELVARSIHALSSRRNQPFVAVNCVSLPPTLIHAELFGFEKGAFTGAHRRQVGHFEAAHRGTIFLDEIGDLDRELQALLLRFLEERTVRRVGGRAEIELDVRVLAATHVDLEAAVRAGRFREDLYYRLNVLRLHMPPLRQRRGDVALLANAFLDRFSGEGNQRLRGLAPSALQAMENYDWPGNVRELLNRVRRAVVMAEGRLITAEDLRLAGGAGAQPVPSLEHARLEAERQALLAALQQSGWSAGKAAQLLGISRATFYRLVGRHGVSVDETGTFEPLAVPLEDRIVQDSLNPEPRDIN